LLPPRSRREEKEGKKRRRECADRGSEVEKKRGKEEGTPFFFSQMLMRQSEIEEKRKGKEKRT